MKYSLLLPAFFIIFFSCDNFQNTSSEEKNEGVEKTTIRNKNATDSNSAYRGDVIPVRDLSISPSNSYSDMFLDSLSVEAFINNKEPGDEIAKGIRNFYLTRNFQFAWFTRDGLTEQGKGLWNLFEYSGASSANNLKDKKLESRMDSLIELQAVPIPRSDSTFITTELLLTQRFIHYLINNSRETNLTGKVFPMYVPAKKEDPLKIAEELLGWPTTNINFNEASHPYSLLKKELTRYVSIARQGSWQPLKGSFSKLKKGNSSPAISEIKNRLKLTGDLTGPDTSRLFNDSLFLAIESLQVRNGLKPNGIINDSVVRLLNVPVRQRIGQILINMNRMM